MVRIEDVMVFGCEGDNWGRFVSSSRQRAEVVSLLADWGAGEVVGLRLYLMIVCSKLA